MNPRYSEAFLAIVLGWIVGFVVMGLGGLLFGTVVGVAFGYWRIKTA